MSLDIKGKGGHIPNPLENSVLEDDETQKVKYIFEAGRPKSLKIVTKKESTYISENKEIIRFSIDHSEEDQIPKIIERIRNRKGRTGGVTIIQEPVMKMEQPTLKQEIAIDLFKYHRSLIKIMYEIAWYFLGDVYLADPLAIRFREVLLDMNFTPTTLKNSKFHGRIGFQKNIINLRWDQSCHYAFLQPRNKHKTMCYIRIFNIFEGILIVAKDTPSEGIGSGIVVENNFLEKSFKIYPVEEFIALGFDGRK